MRFLIVTLVLLSTPSVHWAEVAAPRLLVVVGIQKEAKLAQGKDVTLLISGASSDRLAEALQTANVTDVQAIISFGVAGGLHPEYESGDVVIPDAITKEGQHWPADFELVTKFRNFLSEKGLRVRDTRLAGSSSVIRTAAEKAKLFEMEGAGAVDMESHVAAKFAADNNIPFVALRVISDPAHRTLPKAALNSINDQGEVKVLAILFSILRNPFQVIGLLHAGLDSRKAFGVLAVCQSLLKN